MQALCIRRAKTSKAPGRPSPDTLNPHAGLRAEPAFELRRRHKIRHQQSAKSYRSTALNYYIGNFLKKVSANQEFFEKIFLRKNLADNPCYFPAKQLKLNRVCSFMGGYAEKKTA